MRHILTTILLSFILLSCKGVVDFPVEDSGKLYVNALMTDQGNCRIQVMQSHPVLGRNPVPLELQDIILTADGSPVELTVNMEQTYDTLISFETGYRFKAGQELALKAEAAGIPEIIAEVTMPESIPEVEIRKSEIESIKDTDGRQGTDMLKTLWMFSIHISEEPRPEEHFGIQVLRRKLYEFLGAVPQETMARYGEDAGIVEADDLYVNTETGENGWMSSIGSDMTLSFDKGEMQISQAVGYGGRSLLTTWVAPTERRMLEMSYNPIMNTNYSVAEYYEYKIRVMRFSEETANYLKARYVIEESDIPIDFGFTPTSYTYTNVIGGLGVFGAASVYESEWTSYE